MSTGLLDAFSLADLVPADNPARDPLVKAGYTTVGAVLGLSPEVLLEQVLNGQNASALSDLIVACETAGRTLTGTVSDLVVSYNRDKRLQAREDLKQADLVKAFSSDLTRAIGTAKLKIPTRSISTVVSDSVGGTSS